MRSFDYLKIRDKKWDLEVLTLIAKIHEYKGKQELYIKQKPMSLEKLVELRKYKVRKHPIKLKVLLRRIQELNSWSTRRHHRETGMKKRLPAIEMF